MRPTTAIVAATAALLAAKPLGVTLDVLPLGAERGGDVGRDQRAVREHRRRTGIDEQRGQRRRVAEERARPEQHDEAETEAEQEPT
mgnify:CR=1 FL=1